MLIELHLSKLSYLSFSKFIKVEKPELLNRSHLSLLLPVFILCFGTLLRAFFKPNLHTIPEETTCN